MRLLLDENLPRKVVRLLAPEAEAVTVEQRGWDSKTNGELLLVPPAP
jgi:predicted nuclease of predicted toxin-antitoxin system